MNADFNSVLSRSSIILFVVCAVCLTRWSYKRLVPKTRSDLVSPPVPNNPSPITPANTFLSSFTKMRHRRPPVEVIESTQTLPPRPTLHRFPHSYSIASRPNHSLKNHLLDPAPTVYHPSNPIPSTTKQPFDVFLVLDVEATCHQGTSFDFPNEIIEFPVSLLRWKDKSEDQKASQLEVVDEFRSFVQPTWRPRLSQFCTDLTGITQDQVDAAPIFPQVLASFRQFMVEHGLIDPKTDQRRVRFCWCTDGPFDIRDFVVKQCFISDIQMPDWLQGDVLDVRLAVTHWLHTQPESSLSQPQLQQRLSSRSTNRRSMNIPSQLEALNLPAFEGRQHSGIDDTRNLAKIVAELAMRGVSLLPNTVVQTNRRWHWMGRRGQVLEDYWNSIPTQSSQNYGTHCHYLSGQTYSINQGGISISFTIQKPQSAAIPIVAPPSSVSAALTAAAGNATSPKSMTTPTLVPKAIAVGP